ncbi:MAG: hypothetical protein I8H94_00020 [Rhodobacteraceae bacterium]|nr:hypothetical protein [Paracoccaceae bacterium]
MLLRLVRAMLPVAALWIGKLIIDEVVRLSARINSGARKQHDIAFCGAAVSARITRSRVLRD